MLSERQLCGLDESHIVFDDSYGSPDNSRSGLHADCHTAWVELQGKGRQAGFDMRIFSGFRNYERQLMIWNAKAAGERAIRDDNDQVLDIDSVSESQLVHAILRFSMLPGASRHHWGTDMDIYDAAAVADDYQVQLTLAEVSRGGVFAPMHEWLDQLIAEDQSCGFFRPYACDRGGVAPERWHVSYRPVAAGCEAQLSLAVLESLVRQSDMLLKDQVCVQLSEIYQRYVLTS